MLAVLLVAQAVLSPAVRLAEADMPRGGSGFAALAASVVSPCPRARFTFLTDRLVRIEWRDDAAIPFEDRPTLAFVQREVAPTPALAQRTRGGVLTVRTDAVVLRYVVGSPFHRDTLSIRPIAKWSRDPAYFATWYYGQTSATDHVHNLKGTVYGLDMQIVLDLDCSKAQPFAGHTEWGRAGKDRGIHQNGLMCQYGLVSRSGWALVDDADNMVVDVERDWWVGSPGTSNVDVVDQYLFAHGEQYGDALQDYARVGGRAPMPPRFALGSMVDRWYDIDAADADRVVQQYAYRQMPIDVFVFDQAFHKKNAGDYKSFDLEMFPNPALTMERLHKQGVGVSINMHDCGGIRADEPLYTTAAKALGFTPAQIELKGYLTGDASGAQGYCRSQTFANAIDDVLLGAMEKDGVDGWWNDWACDGEDPEVSGDHAQGCEGGKMSPTMWYNRHRYTAKRRRRFAEAERNATRDGIPTVAALEAVMSGSVDEDRGFVLGRYGGLGSHRYPLGFSGDVDKVSWTTLRFSIYMTGCSTNAAYGVWSHDILGPMYRNMASVAELKASPRQTAHDAQAQWYETFELGTRWLQWGAFSPVLRTHDRGASAGGCANKHWPDIFGDCAQLRPWHVPPMFADANRAVMRTRAELIPYIYTAYRELFDTGLGIIRPCYYEWPRAMAAYSKAPEATGVPAGDYELSDEAKLANSANQVANQVNAQAGRRRLMDDYDVSFAEQDSHATDGTEVAGLLHRVEVELHSALRGRASARRPTAATNDAASMMTQFPGVWEPRSEHQFMFGPDLLVAPITTPADPQNDTMGVVDVWMPPGRWVERHSGAIFTGAPIVGSLIERMRFHLSEVPVFVRAGAVIATIPLFDGTAASSKRDDSGGSTIGTARRNFEHLVFTAHLDAGSSTAGSSTHVYEDDGRSTAYLSAAPLSSHAWTTASYKWDDRGTQRSSLRFSVTTHGSYPELPAERTYTVCVRNAVPAESVTVLGHATPLPVCGVLGYTGVDDYPRGCVHYDGTDTSLLVTVPQVRTSGGLDIDITFGSFASALVWMPGIRGAIEHARIAKSTLDEARANPAGQCCEWPNDQPLKRLASFGARLESLARDTTEGASRRFLRVSEKVHKLIAAAAEEVRVLYDAPTAALRALHALYKGAAAVLGDALPEASHIRNSAISFLSKKPGIDKKALHKLSNLEMALAYASDQLVEGDFSPKTVLLVLYELAHPNSDMDPDLDNARNGAVHHVVLRGAPLAEVQRLNNLEIARKYAKNLLAKKRLSIVDLDLKRRTSHGRLAHAHALLESSVERCGVPSAGAAE